MSSYNLKQILTSSFESELELSCNYLWPLVLFSRKQPRKLQTIATERDGNRFLSILLKVNKENVCFTNRTY